MLRSYKAEQLSFKFTELSKYAQSDGYYLNPFGKHFLPDCFSTLTAVLQTRRLAAGWREHGLYSWQGTKYLTLFLNYSGSSRRQTYTAMRH
jgi:hypothetical protein